LRGLSTTSDRHAFRRHAFRDRAFFGYIRGFRVSTRARYTQNFPASKTFKFKNDDDTLVTDPQTEISLIYYNNRGGLEDRVFRIKTDRSSATSLPEPRTSHNISNVEIVGQSGDTVEVRFNWFTLYYRYQNIDPYFGTSFYTLDVSGTSPLIKKKKVVLKNDYIHHVVDIYHV
jgi:benzoate 1,2-dioxygenase small subunit